LSSVGCLALVAKSRWQRSKIEKLQQQIAGQNVSGALVSSSTR
jgi:hypothetical protein